MIDMYAIPNCDTVRKARRWLEAESIAYVFHDFKREGLDAEILDTWCEQVGWEVLLNRKGMTWRRLPAEQREDVDEARAKALMLEKTSIVKRPVLIVDGNVVHVGFDADAYAACLTR